MAQHTSKFGQRQTLKVVPRKPLRAGGLAPASDMQPGPYVAACVEATEINKGKNRLAVLQFRIVDEAYEGTDLRQWLSIPDVGGIVSLHSRYVRSCSLSLGGDSEPADCMEPDAIFKGFTFLVEVNYRKTAKTGCA